MSDSVALQPAATVGSGSVREPGVGSQADITGWSPASAAVQHVPRVDMGNKLDAVPANVHSTAEIAANSPRYRRKSSTFIDGIHDVSEDQGDLAPAQLYSTMSGRLFHSGRIAIVMVGLPARGKT